MYIVTGLLGITLTIAPFTFGYSENFLAVAASITLGMIAVAASVLEGATFGKGRWEYWLLGIIGFSAIVAPFIFGYVNLQSASLATIVIGVLLAYIAGTELYYDNKTV